MSSEKRFLFALAAVQFINILDFVIMMPLSPALMTQLSLPPDRFSIVVSSYAFTACISGILASFVVDRFERKRFLMFVFIGLLVSTLLCGLANSFELLLAARIVAGFFGGVTGAHVLSMVADGVPPERRAYAMAWVMASFSVASAVGIPAGLAVADAFQAWNAPFLALTILAIGVGIYSWFSLPSMTAHLQKEGGTARLLAFYQNIFKNTNAVWALLLSAGIIMGQFVIIPFLNKYLVANVGMPSDYIKYIYLIGGVLTVVTSPRLGALADKIGKHKVFYVSAILSVAPILVITHLPPVASWMLFILSGFFFIVIGGRMVAGMSLVASSITPQDRGMFMNLNGSVQNIALSLASLVAGSLVHQLPDGTLTGFQYTGYVAVGFTLISLWLTSRVVDLSRPA